MSVDKDITAYLQQAVAAWARETHATDAVVIGGVDIEEDRERFLVDVAVKPVGHWILVEVWLDEQKQVQAINDLGEGLPLDGRGWPWADEAAG
jgi:hypothetical protein